MVSLSDIANDSFAQSRGSEAFQFVTISGVMFAIRSVAASGRVGFHVSLDKTVAPSDVQVSRPLAGDTNIASAPAILKRAVWRLMDVTDPVLPGVERD